MANLVLSCHVHAHERPRLDGGSSYMSRSRIRTCIRKRAAVTELYLLVLIRRQAVVRCGRDLRGPQAIHVFGTHAVQPVHGRHRRMALLRRHDFQDTAGRPTVYVST